MIKTRLTDKFFILRYSCLFSRFRNDCVQVEEKVKEAAEISMGTEISEEDVINIKHLCQQVVDIQVSLYFSYF